MENVFSENQNVAGGTRCSGETQFNTIDPVYRTQLSSAPCSQISFIYFILLV